MHTTHAAAPHASSADLGRRRERCGAPPRGAHGDAWHPIRIRIDWLRETGLPRLKRLPPRKAGRSRRSARASSSTLSEGPLPEAERAAGRAVSSRCAPTCARSKPWARPMSCSTPTMTIPRRRGATSRHWRLLEDGGRRPGIPRGPSALEHGRSCSGSARPRRSCSRPASRAEDHAPWSHSERDARRRLSRLPVRPSPDHQRGRPSLEVKTRNTRGSTENVPLLEAGQLDLALVQGEVAHEALAGIGRPPADSRSWRRCTRRPACSSCAASVSQYRGIGDLKGEAVARGARGSGLVVLARVRPDGSASTWRVISSRSTSTRPAMVPPWSWMAARPHSGRRIRAGRASLAVTRGAQGRALHWTNSGGEDAHPGKHAFLKTLTIPAGAYPGRPSPSSPSARGASYPGPARPRRETAYRSRARCSAAKPAAPGPAAPGDGATAANTAAASRPDLIHPARGAIFTSRSALGESMAMAWRWDLSSDTVTKPTQDMRRFMCEAEVGDEQKHEDPTVNLLQEMVAELLGKEAALFLPSGTMCNEIALRVHCRHGDEMLAHQSAHPIHFEGGGPGSAGRRQRPALDGAAWAVRRGDPRGRHPAGQSPHAAEPSRLDRADGRRISRVAAPSAASKGARGHRRGPAPRARHSHGRRAPHECRGRHGRVGAQWAAPRLGVDRLHQGAGRRSAQSLAGPRDFIAEAWRLKQAEMGGAMRQSRASSPPAGSTRSATTSSDWPRTTPMRGAWPRALRKLPGIELDPATVETTSSLRISRGRSTPAAVHRAAGARRWGRSARPSAPSPIWT